METLVIDYSKNNPHGKKITYKLIPNGGEMPIAYQLETPDEVVNVLERVRKSQTRVKLYYGDHETGRDWCEEYDTTGRIGLSRGHDAMFPILVYNERSLGGGRILDHRVVRVVETGSKRELYRAKNYQPPVIEVREQEYEAQGKKYTHETIVNGKLYGRHTSLKSAENLKKKLS